MGSTGARSCTSCDTPVPDGAAFCPACGAATPTDLNVRFGTGFEERLQAALAEHYEIVRELGQGGMAVVFLAHDRKHDRDVALKVMRPELATSIGPERFLREIRIAAKLSHPHILPVFDSGEAAGFLYYVMPFVEGESLRQRLHRDGPLPIEEALRIARETAAALSYAHSQDIVHRDVKPENILLHHGEAMVADFGIARAVAEGGTRLTETGIAVGTPLYMSPEQASGTKAVAGSSDLYSLACVLFEMLTGEPPFGGNSTQAILARHAIEPPPSIKTLRSTVPDYVDGAVGRALAKVPADRHATGTEFAEALMGDIGAPLQREPGRRRAWLYAVAALAAVAGAVGVVKVALQPPVAAEPVRIAVLPFVVQGADSASPAWELARAMGDLFDIKVRPEHGFRIVFPPAVAREWQLAGGSLETGLPDELELEVARRVGAGMLVRGTVVAVADTLTVAAGVVDVATGATRGMPQRRTGRVQQRYALVDQVVRLSLAQALGAPPDSIPPMAAYRPEAIEAWMEGRRTAGRAKKKELYRAALAADSSFIVPAFEIFYAGESPEDLAEAQFAWEHRDQLPERLQMYLRLAAGSLGIGPVRTLAGRVAAMEELIDQFPEVMELSSEIGALVAREGALASIPDWANKASRAFERNEYHESGGRWWLMDLAMLDEDTTRARAEFTVFPQAQGGLLKRISDGYRWRFAVWADDTAGAQRALDEATDHLYVVGAAMADARMLEQVDALFADQRFVPVAMREEFGWLWGWVRGNEGLWRSGWEARRDRSSVSTPLSDAAIPVFESLFLGMPEDSLVLDALQHIETTAAAAMSGARATSVSEADRDAFAVIWLAVWRLRHGESRGVDEAVRYLQEQTPFPYRYEGWTHIIDVLSSEVNGGDVPSVLLRMDSVVRELPLPMPFNSWFPHPPEVQNLFLARMLARYGELDRALEASRRRRYLAGFQAYYQSLPEYLREEGRLAAAVGDTAGAIKAYEHYLALREDPDPPWRPQWDSVRTELAALVAR
jgi:hypothetical protein